MSCPLRTFGVSKPAGLARSGCCVVYSVAMQTFAYALLLATQAAAATAPPRPAPSISEDTVRWWREFPTGVRTLPIESSRSIELFCQGKGFPTVILESGLGGKMFTWRKVQPVLARRFRVCAYSRAGIGGSSFGPMPRDAVAIVSDLEKLVRRAQLRPPYILVGHSLGGFTVRLFARRNLRRTAGLVLVDPAAEGLLERWAAIARVDIYRGHLDFLQRCSARADGPDCKVPSLDDDQLLVRRPAEWRTMVSELESFAPGGRDEAQIRAAGSDLEAIPLLVLTADWVPPLQEELSPAQRRALLDEGIARHKAVAGHSRRGIHKFIVGTSHDIQLDRPEAVIEAVEQIASMAATPATSAPDFGNSELEVERVRQAEQERLRALVGVDMAVARRLHADDFQVVSPLGLTASREQYLGYIANGTVDYLRWEPGPIVVRQNGRMAAIRYKSTVDMITRGERRPTREAWNTGLYEHRDGRWQIVWFHATEIVSGR